MFFDVFMLQKYINSKQDFQIKRYPLCLGNISKDFAVNSMKKKRLNGNMYDFSIDYNSIDISDITNIHKYLMKKHDIKCLD